MNKQTEEIANEELEVAENVTEDQGNDIVVLFGDDDGDTTQDSSTVKQMREAIKDLKNQNKELRKGKAKTEELPALGARPTLEDSGYDEVEFNGALDKYYEDKTKHEAAEKSKQSDLDQQEQAWGERMSEYRSGFSTFDSDASTEAEGTVKSVLSEMQHNTLIETFGKGAAPLMIGLAANDERLGELSKIKSIARFIAAATRLEMSMKVTSRTPSTSPESKVSGSGIGSLGDKTLENLEAEADRTGNRTAIQAHKRKLRQAEK